jgi:hypothetical protein
MIRAASMASKEMPRDREIAKSAKFAFGVPILASGLNILFIYLSLDYFILNLYANVLQMTYSRSVSEEAADWLLQAALASPGQVPFTILFVVSGLIMWLRTKGQPVRFEKFLHCAFLIATILFFFFVSHIVFNYLVDLLPSASERVSGR